MKKWVYQSVYFFFFNFFFTSLQGRAQWKMKAAYQDVVALF